jgi:DNA-binding beta-propeller fold protein YncE
VPLSGPSTIQRCQYLGENNGAYTSLNYNNDLNSLLITEGGPHDTFDERFLSFNLDISNNIGKYNDTLYVFFDTSSNPLLNTWTFDFSFNVYTPYLVIDPSNIAPNVPTNTTFHFVTPNVVPEPTDSYMLRCNGTDISDVFCNNCTYNKEKFLAGTYPTGLVYSTDTNYLYVALQNNTISRVDLSGNVDNNYFPPELGLVGPTSLVLDASYDMFILNAGSDFISYLTLRNNIISINNSFYTGIYKPICLTYDPETDLLYLLSGAVPNTRITRINARTGVGVVLPIAFGTLYDPNGLTIDAYYGLFAPTNLAQPPNTKYLYVSNTDQNNNNSILRVNLTTTDLSGNITYAVTTLVSSLTYKPFTMANQNDGFLYVANKNNNSLSKISITGLAPNIQPWAVNGISVPVDLGFDGSGNLYIANAGSNPRNSRISKIYVDSFFFTNVKLTNGTCANTKIYDLTTQSYVDIGYYASPNQYSFPIPVPYPIGS